MFAYPSYEYCEESTGAALVDEQGRETPITHAMVEQALQNLLIDEWLHCTRAYWLPGSQGRRCVQAEIQHA